MARWRIRGTTLRLLSLPAFSSFIVITASFCGRAGAAQRGGTDTIQSAPDSTWTPAAISIQAAVNALEIPRNRTLTYTITATWHGRQSRFVWDAFPTPGVTNLDVVETPTPH